MILNKPKGLGVLLFCLLALFVLFFSLFWFFAHQGSYGGAFLPKDFPVRITQNGAVLLSEHTALSLPASARSCRREREGLSHMPIPKRSRGSSSALAWPSCARTPPPARVSPAEAILACLRRSRPLSDPDVARRKDNFWPIRDKEWPARSLDFSPALC